MPPRGVDTGCDQVGGTRAKGRQTDAGLAGQAAIGGGHEARRLLVTGQYQLDLQLAQGLQQVEVLLARDAEYILDTSFSRHCTTTSAALAI